MCFSITTADADSGEATPITAIHSDIIQSHILTRLDGQTLASTSCASAQLLSLCGEDLLWKRICNATWPSTTDSAVQNAISALPSGHRSLYSDAFPSVRCHNISRTSLPKTSELISAVDIYFDDKLLYSKVLESETRSRWFLTSPFRLDLLDTNESVPTPLKFEGEDGACAERARERLRISWILIDPSKKRAANIASARAVEARRHWLTEDLQLRYATVVRGGDGELVQCAVVVTCSGKEGGELRVREASVQVEDMEGKILSGFDSLRILDAAMEGQRSRSDVRTERDIYGMFLRMKVLYRERKYRRERRLDMVFIAAGFAIFVAIWTFLLSR